MLMFDWGRSWLVVFLLFLLLRVGGRMAEIWPRFVEQSCIGGG